MSNKLSKLFIGAMIILGGCIDEFDFDNEIESGVLVVDGRFTDSFGPHEIRLGKTPENSTVLEPETGAQVWLRNIDGSGVLLPESEIEEGVYILEGGTFQGIRGQTYFLEFTLADGETYRSLPETMPTVTASDTAYFQFGIEESVSPNGIIIERNVVRTFLDSEVPDEEVYLRWEAQDVTVRFSLDPELPGAGVQIICYITIFPDPQNITLFDGGDANGFAIEGEEISSRVIGDDFFYRNVVNVIQSSMTVEAYDYWERVDQIINSVGTIFDVPGAVVPGNVFNVNDENERVLGYFEASARDTSRFILNRNLFPEEPTIFDPCGNLRVNRQNIEGCRNCLSIRNSSRIRPSFWPN